MILEKFQTNKFDNEIVLLRKEQQMTMREFKQYVFAQTEFLKKSEKINMVLTYDNEFNFIVNFFASLFAQKNIYLLTDKKRFQNLKFEYYAPEILATPCGTDNFKFNEEEVKRTKINLFTSGSTAEPKMISRTFDNIEVEAKAIIEEFNLRGNKFTVYSTTAMTHLFGLTMLLFVPLCGNFIINTDRIEFPEQLNNVKTDYFLVSTPSFLEKAAKYGQNFEIPPHSVYAAGDKLKQSVSDFFSTSTTVIEIYGSSETGVVAYKDNNSPHLKTFKPVLISTDNNNCITVTSPFFESNQITISDVIEKFSDKEFDVIGRADRMVKIKDKRVSLTETEEILKKHPKVKDSYCFKHNDNLVCAVIGTDVSLDESELKSHLSKYGEILLKKWRILDEIPKTKTGKTDKNKLKQIFDTNLTYPFIFERRKIENGYEVDLLFKEKSNFFKGHFDIMPILPGVVQLYYASWFIKEFFDFDTIKKEVKRVKFSNIIRSNKKVTLRVTEKESAFEYAYLSDDKVYSTGIFVK